MLYTLWHTGHPINDNVTSEFRRGGQFSYKHIGFFDRPVPSISYGFIRGPEKAYKACEREGIDWWEIDRGYFRPSHFDGYYRLTRRGLQGTYDHYAACELKDDRWRALKIPTLPVRKTGKHILLCPPTSASLDFYDSIPVSPADWTEAVKLELKKHTDRPIRVRDKFSSTNSLESDLADCWCVVTFNSSVAWLALLAGIPAIATGPCIIKDWNKCTLEHIESNWTSGAGDLRDHLFVSMSYQQWTLAEMASGKAWRMSQELQI